MPAIMMSPVVGGRLVVTGSRMARVAGGPSPGRIPTNVPITTPTATHSRFVGVNAEPNPASRLCSASITSPSTTPPWRRAEVSNAVEQRRSRQVDPQHEDEERVGDHGDRHDHRGGLPVPNALDEQNQIGDQQDGRRHESDQTHQGDTGDQPDPDTARTPKLSPDTGQLADGSAAVAH